MTINATRAQRRQLERDNAKRPPHLELLPRHEWPPEVERLTLAPTAVWRSRDFLVQQYPAPAPAMCRLSIQRTSLIGDRWTDNIAWDELQRLKSEAGFTLAWAVEVYPDMREVVNIANLRHLWILPQAPAFAWQRRLLSQAPPAPSTRVPAFGTAV